ncbi:hypothetical protein [Megasphaera sueciensis]|uniref:hypothetical protein n=1 Tax=Megasphaera sueciensis TaxID=349094 RepID=UPI003CFFC43A
MRSPRISIYTYGIRSKIKEFCVNHNAEFKTIKILGVGAQGEEIKVKIYLPKECFDDAVKEFRSNLFCVEN